MACLVVTLTRAVIHAPFVGTLTAPPPGPVTLPSLLQMNWMAELLPVEWGLWIRGCMSTTKWFCWQLQTPCAASVWQVTIKPEVKTFPIVVIFVIWITFVCMKENIDALCVTRASVYGTANPNPRLSHGARNTGGTHGSKGLGDLQTTKKTCSHQKQFRKTVTSRLFGSLQTQHGNYLTGKMFNQDKTRIVTTFVAKTNPSWFLHLRHRLRSVLAT